MAKKLVSYDELKTQVCKDGEKHKVWLSLLGDGHPAFCSVCGDHANDVPDSEYEDL
jgi:coenzyme F420-reducing hydrogenase beta subunit